MMFTTRDTKGHTQMCLTFIFKVNHQGQVTDFRFSEILDLENVRIDTKIKSVVCIQPEIRKVTQWISVTLSSKVNRQGHVIFSNIFDILDLENVRIDIKINFVSCLQPKIRKVMQKGVWPRFSRSCNKDIIFSLSRLDSLTPKTYPWAIFSKNSDGKAKIQGGGIHPPLGVRRWIFSLGVWGLRTCHDVPQSRSWRGIRAILKRLSVSVMTFIFISRVHLVYLQWSNTFRIQLEYRAAGQTPMRMRFHLGIFLHHLHVQLCSGTISGVVRHETPVRLRPGFDSSATDHVTKYVINPFPKMAWEVRHELVKLASQQAYNHSTRIIIIMNFYSPVSNTRCH